MAIRLREDVRTGLAKFPAGHYKTVYADPPWAERGAGASKRGADKHYGLMNQSDLLALSPAIKRIASPDSHLYLWVTNNFLEDGIELTRAWGFEYKTMITWAKDKFGIGQYFRGQTEHCIFGVRGCPPYKIDTVRSAQPRLWAATDDGEATEDDEDDRLQGSTLLTAPRGKHSAKPFQMRDTIELVSYEPRIEIFGPGGAG